MRLKIFSIPPMMFQFTRPRRARPAGLGERGGPAMFQFTRPRRARLLSIHGPATSKKFQFTRPRRARRRRVYHKERCGFNGGVPRTHVQGVLRFACQGAEFDPTNDTEMSCKIRERSGKWPGAQGSRKTRGAGAVRGRERVWRRHARCALHNCLRGCSSEDCRSPARRCPPARP